MAKSKKDTSRTPGKKDAVKKKVGKGSKDKVKKKVKSKTKGKK